ncbi:MAG: exo-alpha-sialidase [Planctomycetes bacterium]|nr:exo-alpha-sialidase [Planctomycetota bacterium]
MPLEKNGPIEILERTVVAGGGPPRQRDFCSMASLPDGELLVAYRQGVGPDRASNGAILLTRSRDGRTWEEPVPVFAEPGWDCAGMSGLRLLPDQSVVLFAGKFKVTPGQGMVSQLNHGHCFLARSEDGGRTWSELSPEIRLFPDFTDFTAHGVVPLTRDGRLILGVVGSRAGYSGWATGVVTSSDSCRSFRDLVVIADDPNLECCDNDILRLDDGRLLAVIRSEKTPFNACQSTSEDDGRTWTPVRPTGFQAGGMTLLRLRSGDLLCAHRDRAPGRPGVSFQLSKDQGQTWRFIGQIYEGTHWFCGYVDFVPFPGGRIFCTYFTSLRNGNSEVQGVWLRDRS